jgi:hypothetical protein
MAAITRRTPKAGDEFKPGEKCNRSGIYEVIHHSAHTNVHHYVTVIFGKTFPSCRSCGDNPRFILVRGAQYYEENRCFREVEEK